MGDNAQADTIAVGPAWWPRTFLVLVGTLSSTILLKAAQIQYLELSYFVQIGLLIVAFQKNDFRMRLFRPYARIGFAYGLFCVFAFALALAALRYDFYLPEALSVLKYPVAITFSRMLELFASVVIMLYLATKFRSESDKLQLTMRIYFWAGVASAVYSILSYPLDVAGVASLGAYSIDHRMRGFYNEGGPYGLYLMSTFLVGVALYKQAWLSKRRLYLTFVLLGVALLKSESKAAFVAILAMFLLNGLLAQSLVRRSALILLGIAFLVVATQVVDLAKGIRIYQQSSAAYERLSHRHSQDPNFVLGRVAGAFIVPRMIAAHPWTGVGWGNYGIVRNAPEYRGASVWADISDDPGLGIFGTSAELGLPLQAYLLGCLLIPYLYLRKLQVPTYLRNLALLQPIVHIFGAQLNLTYPWIVTAFALGLGYSTSRVAAAAPSTQEIQLS